MTASLTNNGRYDAVVIGGGHNGLTAAALLAKDGRKVILLERRSVLGGTATGEEFHPGYTSAGLHHDASCVRAQVVEALNLKAHGLKVLRDPPPVFAPCLPEKGRGLLLHHQPGEAAAEIGALSAGDADKYAQYRAFFGRIRRFTERMFSEPPPDTTAPGTGEILRLMGNALALRRLGRKDMREVLRVAPMCVADWLNEWFDCELLKCLLAGPALRGEFAGPWSPGTNANLVRREAGISAVVAGGPQSLIDALRRAAEANGVEIRAGSAVAKIRVSGGRVDGVTLDGGEPVDARVVAASCDPKRTFLELIDCHDITPKLEHRIQHLRMRGTTAKVNLAVSAPPRFACRPDLEVEHARTGETLDGMERAFDAVKYGRFSETPILDVYVPTVANPSHAPQGHGVVSLVAHFAPYFVADGWNDEQRERLGDTIVDALQQYVPGIKESILGREVLTPADIEGRYGLTHGHIHHGEHALDQLLVRPCPEAARYATPIEGLYLCGSGSHPGGGITCAPGALGASTILKNGARL